MDLLGKNTGIEVVARGPDVFDVASSIRLPTPLRLLCGIPHDMGAHRMACLNARGDRIRPRHAHAPRSGRSRSLGN